MQAADVLRDRAPPRHRKREKQGVQARIIEAFADVFARRQDDSTLFGPDSRQPFRRRSPLLLPHPTSEDHDVRDARGERAFETIEVLVSFGQHKWRSARTDGLSNLLADHSIARLVLHQELIKCLKLDSFVGPGATG